MCTTVIFIWLTPRIFDHKIHVVNIWEVLNAIYLLQFHAETEECFYESWDYTKLTLCQFLLIIWRLSWLHDTFIHLSLNGLLTFSTITNLFFASLLLSINQKPFLQVLNKECPTPFLPSLDSIISHILHFFQNLTPVIIHCLPVTSISTYWHSILPRKALLIWFLSCSKKFTDIKIFDVSLLQSGSIYFHSVEISFWKKKS